MEEKIAVIGIVISDYEAVEKVNGILHEYRDFIVGRFGIPYKKKQVNIISVVLDAETQVLNSISGKLGMINGVKSKVMITK